MGLAEKHGRGLVMKLVLKLSINLSIIPSINLINTFVLLMSNDKYSE